MQRLRGTLQPAVASVRLTIADPGLRRLLLSWLAGCAGKGAFLVATFVLAYDAGGAVAIGILGLAQFLPQMLLAPFAGLPAARWRPEIVLRSVYAFRTLAVMLAIGVVGANLSIEALYVVVVLEAALSAFSRPLQMALLPGLASTPEQLVGANVGSSAGEGLGTFLGPAVAGLLLVVAGPLAALVAALGMYAIGVAAIADLEVQAVGRPTTDVRQVVGQLTTGVRSVARAASLRILFIGIGAQTLVRGALNVLIVVASIELLGMGDGGVGTLQAAIGLGGLVGAALATMLAGGGRLRVAYVASLVGWGVPIAFVGFVAGPVVAIGAMLVVGLSNTVLDVAAFTLIQRLTPNASRIAVLGLVDMVANGAIAAGGLIAPVLIDAIGVEPALVATGALLPAIALASWPFVRRIDEGGITDLHRVARLQGDPLFRPLSLMTIEHLAGALDDVRFDDGDWLMREGEVGDEYLLLDEGRAEVIQDGRPVRTVVPGQGVGEIALMSGGLRTASVLAVGSVRALSVRRDTFLEAITGHPVSRDVAHRRSADLRAADEERRRLH